MVLGTPAEKSGASNSTAPVNGHQFVNLAVWMQTTPVIRTDGETLGRFFFLLKIILLITAPYSSKMCVSICAVKVTSTFTVYEKDVRVCLQKRKSCWVTVDWVSWKWLVLWVPVFSACGKGDGNYSPWLQQAILSVVRIGCQSSKDSRYYYINNQLQWCLQEGSNQSIWWKQNPTIVMQDPYFLDV